jgi:hypothetical protein
VTVQLLITAIAKAVAAPAMGTPDPELQVENQRVGSEPVMALQEPWPVMRRPTTDTPNLDHLVTVEIE